VFLLLNSLASKFSSQGHFHTLQLLNISQFLFCPVRLSQRYSVGVIKSTISLKERVRSVAARASYNVCEVCSQCSCNSTLTD